MKTLSLLSATAIVLACAIPAAAADSVPGTQRAEREARFNAWCQANADKCREVLAWRQQCQADPEKCRAEIQTRREAMRAQCQADPEKCRAEAQARVDARFRQADANSDGGLSREEAQKAMPRLARHFDQVDANRDGIVTMEELQAARKVRFEARRGRAI